MKTVSTSAKARCSDAARTTDRPGRHVFAAVLLVLTIAGSALGRTAATVVGHDLRPRQITVQNLRNGVLGYFGSDRQYRTAPISEHLRISLEHEPTSPTPAERDTDSTKILELTDGQRFRGHFHPDVGTGQVLRWRHAELGEIDVDLERVRAIRPYDAARAASYGGTDRATLTNGDVLLGFVTELTDDGLAMAVQGRTDPIVIGVEQLAWLELANPPTPRRRDADMLHLADGSCVFAEAVAIEADGLSFSPSQWSSRTMLDLPLASLVRIDPFAANAELVDLASLQGTVTDGGKVFGLAWPPGRADGADVLLHAPVTIQYALPRGTQRLAATAVLATEPGASNELADFIVTVAVDGQDIGSYHISAAQPTASINLLSAGSVLTIRLDPGINGPVMDRLRLVEPMLLVHPAEAVQPGL